MPNIQYQKGRNKEYYIKSKLKATGKYDILQRSASSKSPVDIWCINSKEKEILLVQVKPNSFTEKQTQRLMEENIRLNGLFNVRFVVK